MASKTITFSAEVRGRAVHPDPATLTAEQRRHLGLPGDLGRPGDGEAGAVGERGDRA